MSTRQRTARPTLAVDGSGRPQAAPATANAFGCAPGLLRFATAPVLAITASDRAHVVLSWPASGGAEALPAETPARIEHLPRRPPPHASQAAPR